MSAITWAQIIGLALRDSGVAAAGLTPSAQMQQDAMLRIQMMIDGWQSDQLFIYHLLDLAKVCVDGRQSYTLGPGGDFNVGSVPPLVDDAFIRQVAPAQPAPVDFPLTVLRSRLDYDQIRLKTLKASPSNCLFYDPGVALGTVYPWPIPSSNYELHCIVRAVLDTVGTDPTLPISLPPVYHECIYANLVVRLCGAHRKEVHKTFAKLAVTSMKKVKRANTQIPVLKQPRGLTRGAKYNIFSDQGG